LDVPTHGEDLEGWEPDDPRVWSRDGDALVIDAAGLNESNALIYREGNWSDFELNVQATLIHGANLQIGFGIAAKRPTVYMLDWLRGMQKMAISNFERGKHGTNVLQLLDFEIEWDREYDLLLVVEGMSVKSYVDEQLVNDVAVKDDLTGTISLETYGPQAIARFRDPRIKVG
tara:strand:- start:53 stop:571 length:519 start_codon:yes stop_codon:yes gene_type:complete